MTDAVHIPARARAANGRLVLPMLRPVDWGQLKRFNPTVMWYARKYAPSTLNRLTIDDLAQYGWIGAALAYARHDPALGIMDHYIKSCIRNAQWAAMWPMREKRQTIWQRAFSDYPARRLHGILNGSLFASFDADGEIEAREAIRHHLRALSHRERYVFQEWAVKDRDMHEVAKEVGLTYFGCHRLVARARKKIETHLLLKKIPPGEEVWRPAV